MKIELLMGYDMRIHPKYCRDEWDTRRKSTFLLEEKTVDPLSVDTSVWPTIFEFREGTPEAPLGDISVNGRAITHTKVIVDMNYSKIDLTYETWNSYEDMKLYLRKYNYYKDNAVPVAVIIILTEAIKKDLFSYNSLLEKTELSEHNLPVEMSFIGYDVGDGDMISGLTNCGYTKEDKAHLNNIFQESINPYGLFDEYHDANKFKEMTNYRVASHAPFYVYGIYSAIK